MNKYLVFSILVVFGAGCIVRTIPTILSYPYPIGYDSINYYLPNLYAHNNDWSDWNTSFPIYLMTIYFFSAIFLSDLYLSFNLVNIFLYGFFSVSTFFIFSIILGQTNIRSVILTFFVIFQLSMLRISWDLYRDLISLIFFNVNLILLRLLNSKTEKSHCIVFYLFISIISAVTILSDRMIGILLIISSFIFSFTFKDKYLFLINFFFLICFSAYFFLFDNTSFFTLPVSPEEILTNPIYDKNTFSTIDISILFISLYGILLPLYILVMFKNSSSLTILKIPSFISLLFSFSWLVVPNYEYLVPERWMIIFGFFISIFGIYGFFLIVNKLKSQFIRNLFSFLFVSAFVIYGIMFVVLPYGYIYSLPSLFGDQTEFVFPLSMSFNSMDIDKSQDMVLLIDWINSNTENNSVIVGSKHWRGWFSLFLTYPREYLYDESFFNLTSDEKLDGTNKSNFSSNLEKNYFTTCKGINSSTHPILYLVDFNRKYKDDFYSNVIYESGEFQIYNLTKHICKS